MILFYIELGLHVLLWAIANQATLGADFEQVKLIAGEMLQGKPPTQDQWNTLLQINGKLLATITLPALQNPPTSKS